MFKPFSREIVKTVQKRMNMKDEQSNLQRLKGKQPFKLPEGYMEGLTERILTQLPEKPHEKEKPVSLLDRVRPWLYMAAVFAGLGLFFKGITSLLPQGEPDALMVKTELPTDSPSDAQAGEEDEDYLEYIEAQYTDYLLAEELARAE